MKHISNARKAREIANDNCTHICLADCSAESYFSSENDCYKAAMQAMKWKDEERKELWRITRNHYQEWAEEQIAQEKQKMIEKACEYWKKELIFPSMSESMKICSQVKINIFKKAMEE